MDATTSLKDEIRRKVSLGNGYALDCPCKTLVKFYGKAASDMDLIHFSSGSAVMLNTEYAPTHLMSEDLLTKLRERKDRLDKELTEKVSKDYNDLMSKVNENIQSLRQGNKDFYTQKAQQELDKWEQAIKSGNTIAAVSHKMMAETYLALARTM